MKRTIFTRKDFHTFWWIVFSWIFISLLAAVSEHITHLHVLQMHLESAGHNYFGQVRFALFIGHFFGGLISGLVGGAFIVFYLRKRSKRRSFAYNVLVNGLIFTGVVTPLALLIVWGTTAAGFKRSLFDPWLVEKVIRNLTSPDIVRRIALPITLGVLTLLVLEVSNKFGQGAFAKFILGKYFHPKEENRIFMFLDLKGSTTYAEKMGHIKYFKLLREFFADITEDILNNRGEVYQYIGDEIVISWPRNPGSSTLDCVSCFFDIDRRINGLSEKYLSKYGWKPEFKAGVHGGLVTVGEMGILKKEILYCGDVLNTSARIQGLCNELKANLLTSHDLVKAFPDESGYQFHAIGEMTLRGRKEAIVLYKVEPGS